VPRRAAFDAVPVSQPGASLSPSLHRGLHAAAAPTDATAHPLLPAPLGGRQGGRGRSHEVRTPPPFLPPSFFSDSGFVRWAGKSRTEATDRERRLRSDARGQTIAVASGEFVSESILLAGWVDGWIHDVAAVERGGTNATAGRWAGRDGSKTNLSFLRSDNYDVPVTVVGRRRRA